LSRNLLTHSTNLLVRWLSACRSSSRPRPQHPDRLPRLSDGFRGRWAATSNQRM